MEGDRGGARGRSRGGARLIALLHRASAFGAVERYVQALARALGDECLLVHPGVEPFEQLGVRTIRLEEPPTRELVRLLRRVRPSVVHVTDVWPQAVVSARLARVRHVLVTHHTPELPRRDNLAGRAWQRFGWALRPEVIYTSEADRARDGRPRSHAIPLGIDLDRFGSGTAALRGDGPLVGTVGRLAPQKDHATLLDAASLVHAERPDVRFAIVGDGELRSDLEQRAAGLPVEFTGWREDVPDVLASFAVFAFPSRFEGLGLAVVEAQAAGVPVVATPVGGVREAVVDGETGLVVPPANPTALAAAILRLLDDPALANRLATAARRRVTQRFSEERMVADTLALYGRRP